MSNAKTKCFECGRDHSIDPETYPLGLRVVVLADFVGGIDQSRYKPLENPIPPRVTIPKDSLGRIIGHTEDGRVMVEFEAENWASVHTFHQLESYFKPEGKTVTKYKDTDRDALIADEIMANTRLTVAAPDLLAASQTALAQMYKLGNILNWEDMIPMEYTEAINGLRAAIGKAKGGE